MKQYLVKTLAALSLIFALSVTVLAQSSTPVVTYNAQTQSFSYQNVMTTTSGTALVPDLFTGLKSVVPGDAITQNIQLSVTNIDADETVKIYLNAENENDDYTALLDSVTITVQSAQEDITESLEDSVLLGTFTKETTQAIALTLTIPTSVGNEISNATAQIDWVFTAQTTEVDDSITGGDVPKTGDPTHRTRWIVISAGALIGLVLLCKPKSKQNKGKDE